MILQRIRSIFHPESYHGWTRTKKYFEGWYFKILDESQSHAIAIIPGVAMDESGKKQAFIQVLDGIKKTAVYHKFPFEDFEAKPADFEVSIGQNHFTLQRIHLELPELSGTLVFEQMVPWPNKWYSPGIMGPFSFVPFMECYHGVLSMDHKISGSLNHNGSLIPFDIGRGYIEKDWGVSFPEGYVWLQSNHFSEEGISVKASVAKIPWLGSYFIGFIAGVWIKNQLISFTTYNGSKLELCEIDKSCVKLIFNHRRYSLELIAIRDSATELASPIQGLMDGRIEESMTSSVQVKLLDRKTNQTILNDISQNTALEVAGNIDPLIKN